MTNIAYLYEGCKSIKFSLHCIVADRTKNMNTLKISIQNVNHINNLTVACFVHQSIFFVLSNSGLRSAGACHSCHRTRMLTDHSETDNHTPTASLESVINLTCMTLSSHMWRTCQLQAERPQLTSGLKPTTLLLSWVWVGWVLWFVFSGKWIILEMRV